MISNPNNTYEIFKKVYSSGTTACTNSLTTYAANNTFKLLKSVYNENCEALNINICNLEDIIKQIVLEMMCEGISCQPTPSPKPPTPSPLPKEKKKPFTINKRKNLNFNSCHCRLNKQYNGALTCKGPYKKLC